MQVKFGIDAKIKKEENRNVDVILDTDKTINGHCLIMGMSGAGKSFQIKKMIRQMLATRSPDENPRIHVYDIHGDLLIEGSSDVMFSMQTPHGLNPLKLSSDPHFGGVRRAIQNFISTMNRCMRVLGNKQESCIRNLLVDVYTRHGFTDDPRTWRINESDTRLVSNDNRVYIDVPIAEKDDLKAVCPNARFDGDNKCWWVPTREYQGAITRWPPKLLRRTYPTITDVLRYAKYVLQQSFLGTNAEAITHLEIANKKAQAFQRKRLDAIREGNKELVDDAVLDALDKARSKCIESFTEYAKKITTGTEFSDLLKYDSLEVLKSVIDRLESLVAIGIFKDSPPPFNSDCPVWRYDLRALTLKEEKKLFVLFHLSEIFASCVAQGETTKLRHILVIDEAHIYAQGSNKDEENPINTIAKEGRKFGLALCLASQSPTHFNDDFITSVGSKFILGIDESYWKSCSSKLMLPIEGLKWVRMQKNMLVQIKGKGDSKTSWVCTTIE